MLACSGPDPDLGIALRLVGYLDCQSRALGENGFQALAGGPMVAGLLSGLITIFVALLGYRLILGNAPSLREGVAGVARVGVVLALTTSWPAFQTLVYRVMVDGPGQVAAIMMPAAGLSADETGGRIQRAYDTIRLGIRLPPQSPISMAPSANDGVAAADRSPLPQADRMPLPQTASVLVLSTVGVTGAFSLAIGFLLAVAPLALLSLLFDATLGVFNGWMQALAGGALASLGARIVTSVDLTMTEAELARLQTMIAQAPIVSADPQGVTTIVLVFALIMLVTTVLALRVAGAFRLPAIGESLNLLREPPTQLQQSINAGAARSLPRMPPYEVIRQQPRVSAIVDALEVTARREQAGFNSDGSFVSTRTMSSMAPQSSPGTISMSLGAQGRRSLGRRSRSSERRDNM